MQINVETSTKRDSSRRFGSVKAKGQKQINVKFSSRTLCYCEYYGTRSNCWNKRRNVPEADHAEITEDSTETENDSEVTTDDITNEMNENKKQVDTGTRRSSRNRSVSERYGIPISSKILEDIL